MAISFQARGILSISPETDRFKPFTEFKSESGWNNPKLIINLTENGYRHSMTIGGNASSLYKADESGTIRINIPATYDASGQKVSDISQEDIPFSERNNKKNLAKAAYWSKFILDLNTPNERAILKKLNQKIKDGEALTTQDLQQLLVSSSSEAIEKINTMNKKHMEFLTAKDFIDAIMKVVTSEQYKDKHFFVARGRFYHSYNAEKQTFYENLEPFQIYLDDEEGDKVDFCTANIDFYYGPNAVDIGAVDKGKLYIKGWIRNYESRLKETVCIPKVLVFDCNYDTEIGKKQVDFITKMYTNTSEDDVWMIPTDVSIIDGAERKEITEADLSDDQKMYIALGLATFEKIKKELGGYVRGETVHEWHWIPNVKAKVVKETGIKVDDTVIRLEETALFDNDSKADGLPFGNEETSTEEKSSEDEFDKLFKM